MYHIVKRMSLVVLVIMNMLGRVRLAQDWRTSLICPLHHLSITLCWKNSMMTNFNLKSIQWEIIYCALLSWSNNTRVITFILIANVHVWYYYVPICAYVGKRSSNQFDLNVLTRISLASLNNFIYNNPHNFHLSFFSGRTT